MTSCSVSTLKESSDSLSKAEGAFLKVKEVLSNSITHRQFTRINEENRKLSDEESFMMRLSSYLIYVNNMSWSVKPRCVAAPVCASYGWKVIEKELLECVSCKQLLSTELPPVWQHKQYDEAVSRLLASLKSKHHQFCSWPLHVSKENYLFDKFVDSELCIKEFYDRLKTMHDCQDNLPVLSSDFHQQLKTSEELLAKVTLLCSAEITNVKEQLFHLAICGWCIKQTEGGKHLLQCSQCLRETDPSLYTASHATQGIGDSAVTRLVPSLTSKEEDCSNDSADEQSDVLHTSADNDDDQPDVVIPTKRRKQNLEIRGFHPLEEHQSWCPWVDTKYKTDNLDSNPGGWRILLNAIETVDSSAANSDSKLKYASHRTGVLIAKKMAKQWITTVSTENTF